MCIRDSIGIEREEGGENVREAKATVDDAAHRGGVTQLHDHDIVNGELKDMVDEHVELGMALELARVHMAPMRNSVSVSSI